MAAKDERTESPGGSEAAMAGALQAAIEDRDLAKVYGKGSGHLAECRKASRLS